ncbi:hypothetical protein GCM10009760_37810 [Kitasatospora kazusensis]|uniref:OmpR/PhoB-type domain-containing protein n=1 Tax=Kitasatospora kazusensis TaxID=407974 RepID=A0ABP5LHD6_9ACTN
MINSLPRPQSPASQGLSIRALGELEVTIDGRPVPLGPVKQRLTLAVLVSRPNTTVSVDLLAEAVWADEPPASARKNLQSYICSLRKLLAPAGRPDRLVRHAGGYVLRVSPAELDLLRFEELLRAGRQAVQLGAAEHGARLLREALDLWSGPLLSDLSAGQAIWQEADRYAARRVAVCEDWAEVELGLGHAPAVAELLAETVREHPLRERLRAAHMTALYRAGRKTEALASYDDIRQYLARELGLDVSPTLEAVHRGVLEDRLVEDRPVEDHGGPGRPRHSVTESVTPQPRHPVVALPADLPDFTGREPYIQDLRQALLGEGRLVVLHGPVGVGKTSLAVHVCHQLQAEYPDGVLSVRLRQENGSPRPAASVLAELFRAAGLLGSVPRSALRAVAQEDCEEAAAVWRSWVARHRVLVLLDDAPDEESVRRLLPGTGSGSVLVTSRRILVGLGPLHQVGLGPFTQNESVTLLSRITGDAWLAGDRAAAERIAGALGRLPLALRVSGTKLALLKYLTPQEYAARLEKCPSLLDELTAGELSVRSRLAAWWHSLPEEVRCQLHRLGHLPRPLFTLADATAALQCNEHVASRTVESLMEVGLLGYPTAEVSAHMALYEMPVLTQLYARESAAA